MTPSYVPSPEAILLSEIFFSKIKNKKLFGVRQYRVSYFKSSSPIENPVDKNVSDKSCLT